MFGFIPVFIVGFVILTVIYAAVSFWSRQVRRGKLRKRWEEDGRPGELETYVEEGLEDYDDSFRRKLILLVYLVPLAAVATIIYVVNFM
ncbi:hypothetical protein ATO6_04945 [Oceanicola sp. 22II-s10i]|uniref:hypothetical protein n=1 Tax=Oceanicola sp. 22II-s10i TaxID=1317116 RepID=UPI000B51E6DC|nr:hypothetical protein [Oceanicola sp. 22II-s10i]OWU86198.1 hypothetical protein ATO6_04945 [Oceanicola sp. 22II-s10i]